MKDLQSELVAGKRRGRAMRHQDRGGAAVEARLVLFVEAVGCSKVQTSVDSARTPGRLENDGLTVQEA